MALDLSKLHAAAASHTTEVQRLLNANASHTAAAKQAAADEMAAQSAIDTLTQEFQAQTAAIKSFNDANGAAPATAASASSATTTTTASTATAATK